MKQQDLDFFKNLLQSKRAEANNTLAEFDRVSNDAGRESSDDRSAYSLHMADRGTDAMEREKSQLLAQRSGDYVEYVEEALERIDNGSFGLCRSCGGDIGRPRLEAVPTATQCISCKENGSGPSK
tara:strand:- start:418 stop:792 length:375 start_codon:yes stop_codon:yes gene_type:complete